MYICEICGAQFKSKYALNGHKVRHLKNRPKRHSIKCCCLLDKKIILACNLDKHIAKLQYNHCIECNILTTNSKFCAHKCSAIYNNRQRIESGWKMKEESKLKISKSMEVFLDSLTQKEYQEYIEKTHPRNNKKSTYKRSPKQEILGPYTKVYFLKCKITNKSFVSTTIKQIHPDLKETRKQYSYSCCFKFGISKYNEWFADAKDLIEQYGWYSTPGSKRTGKRNINGISRDHLYSVNDGWINGIDPSIIRHPANCSLIPHLKNQTKGKKSHITIEELYKRISLFESIYGKYIEK